MEKNLDNTNVADVKATTPDVVIFGDGDAWRLLSKASSKEQGWMKSTKAMEIHNVGCCVQVTTQQRNPDSTNTNVAEAVTFIPRVKIVENKDSNGTVTGRYLKAIGI